MDIYTLIATKILTLFIHFIFLHLVIQLKVVSVKYTETDNALLWSAATAMWILGQIQWTV